MSLPIRKIRDLCPCQEIVMLSRLTILCHLKTPRWISLLTATSTSLVQPQLLQTLARNLSRTPALLLVQVHTHHTLLGNLQIKYHTALRRE